MYANPSSRYYQSSSSSSSSTSTTSSSGSSWVQRTEMMEAAMRLVSISEHVPINVGYPSSSSSANSLTGGWGNTLSRKSYKVDLASLAQSDDASFDSSYCPPFQSNDDSESNSEGWGYFIDSPSCH